jgi:hypothetical protein
MSLPGQQCEVVVPFTPHGDGTSYLWVFVTHKKQRPTYRLWTCGNADGNLEPIQHVPDDSFLSLEKL